MDSQIDSSQTDGGRRRVFARSAVRGLRSAISIIVAQRLPSGDAARTAPVLSWIVPFGLLLGLTYAGVFRAAWRVFGEVDGVRLLPATAVWVIGLLAIDRRGPIGLVRVLSGPREANPEDSPGDALSANRLPLLIVACVLPLIGWMAIPNAASTWPGAWGPWFNFAYPRAIFRPLVLAPLWAAWGWVAAAGAGRAHEQAGPVARTLCSAGSVRMTLGWLVLPLTLTLVYSGTHGRWTVGCLISLAVFGITHLYAIGVARRVGGQTLDTLASTAWVAQLSFLILFLAARHRLFAG